MIRFPISVVLLACFVASVRGDDFPEIYNSEPDKNLQPLNAEDAARGMQAPPGFRVQVYASEPDVQNPIDMAWDARGRIWIAENYTYAERAQKFDLSLRDRVVILHDQDGDGRADKRTVFTDQVQMLTSVEVGLGGVWLMCPEQLLFLPDADRDDRPDGPPQVVLDGFTVAKENYHNFANGLRWGPDGWLYGRCGGSCPGRVGKPGTDDEQRVALEGGIWRYHPKTERFEVLVHGTTNPWGHDWNAMGECFFINTVNGHLWHLIPGAHFMRPFTLDPNPHVYELIDMHADHWHFDTGGSWTKSRDGAANEYGGGHAHVGMMIYQADNWPANYRDRLFTWNLHGQRANQEILHRHGSGYVGKHGDDLLLAKDPFFRGMELSYGPDGAVYAIDWSDTGECHEHTGVHRTSGRIFRITHGEAARREQYDLTKFKDLQLAQMHVDNNEWFVRQARMQLIERKRERHLDPPAVEALQQIAQGDDASDAYRALLSLYATESLTRDQLVGFLDHENEHLRTWAVRLLSDHWPLDDVFGPPKVSAETAAQVEADQRELFRRLVEQAEKDESGLVRLALASTVSRLPVGRGHRVNMARTLMNHSSDANDHNLPLLVWYGLIPLVNKKPTWAATLAIESHWPKTRRFIARRLAEMIDENPQAVATLTKHLSTAEDASLRADLLQGLADGLRGRSKAKKPLAWEAVVRAAQNDSRELQAIVRDLSVLFGDGRALGEVRKLVLDADADPALRRSALQTLVDRDSEKLQSICLEAIKDRRLNVVAAQGLAKSKRIESASALIENYRRFRAPQRPKIIAILVSRPNFAAALLDAVAANKIPAADLTAFDVRQIRSLGDNSLSKRTSELWGELRESPQAKRERIAELKADLEQHVADANPSNGRALFNRSCAKCHRLFGVGEKIGPELTGANRNNFDYLLENIVDPSAVVSKNYRMTVLQTDDGRVLNGLVVSKSEKTIVLQTQTDKLTIPLSDISGTRLTSASPMPDGLLDNLSSQQIRDLISYLMQPSQSPLPQ